MWISRSTNGIISLWSYKPTKRKDGIYGDSYQSPIDSFTEIGLKRYFPNTPLPRKGSCREIKGLQIIEKE